MPKVELVRGRVPVDLSPHWQRTIPLTKCLPYYQKQPGAYVHRVRRGLIFLRHDGSAGPFNGKWSHTAFSFWCGGGGFADNSNYGGVGKKRKGGFLYEHAPEGEVLCVTCEGRAIGAGMEDSHQINGRMVRFAPRQPRKPKCPTLSQ